MRVYWYCNRNKEKTEKTDILFSNLWTTRKSKERISPKVSGVSTECYYLQLHKMVCYSPRLNPKLGHIRMLKILRGGIGIHSSLLYPKWSLWEQSELGQSRHRKVKHYHHKNDVSIKCYQTTKLPSSTHLIYTDEFWNIILTIVFIYR